MRRNEEDLVRFKDLPSQQRAEILDHLSAAKAERTKWKLRRVEPGFVYDQYGLPNVDSGKVGVLKASILEHGFSVPIVVDGIDGWLEGNHRTVAAIEAGLETIPAYTRER